MEAEKREAGCPGARLRIEQIGRSRWLKKNEVWISPLPAAQLSLPSCNVISWSQHRNEVATTPNYETGLEGRLADLHSRVHRGAYRAQPSRRVYIPKADGRQRPLGIAALEDKIVQQAVVTILNEIYEADFRGFSYGFRPGRNQHQALDALNVGDQRKKSELGAGCGHPGLLRPN